MNFPGAPDKAALLFLSCLCRVRLVRGEARRHHSPPIQLNLQRGEAFFQTSASLQKRRASFEDSPPVNSPLGAALPLRRLLSSPLQRRRGDISLKSCLAVTSVASQMAPVHTKIRNSPEEAALWRKQRRSRRKLAADDGGAT